MYLNLISMYLCWGPWICIWICFDLGFELAFVTAHVSVFEIEVFLYNTTVLKNKLDKYCWLSFTSCTWIYRDLFLSLQGFKQHAHTLKHEKRIHQGIDPLQCQVLQRNSPFLIDFDNCRHALRDFPILKNWRFMESESMGTKNRTSATFVDKVLRPSKPFTNTWKRTAVKDLLRKFLHDIVYWYDNLYCFQLWFMRWGVYPEWSF